MGAEEEEEEGMSEEVKIRGRRHHDDDHFDGFTIRTENDVELRAFMVPRYKTSGGDEWRVHAQLEVKYLGQDPMVSRGFSSMKTLLANAGYFVWTGARGLLGTPDALLIGRRKGVELFRQVFPIFGDAALGFGWHATIASEGTAGVKFHDMTSDEERAVCQQVGCCAKPINVYRIKTFTLRDGTGQHEPKPYEAQHTWYCSRHTQRGDCGIEGCDTNLVLVSGNGIPVVHETDLSPSGLAIL